MLTKRSQPEIMKLPFKYKVTFLILFCGSLVFAQFNTLTRNSMKKDEVFPKKEEMQQDGKDKDEKVKYEKEKKKSSRIKFFNTTSKSDLKRELDSLKILMLKYSLSKNKEQKLNFKKIEDSLIQMMKKNIENSTQINSRTSIKQYDFVNDDQPNAITKTFMPLKNGIMVTSPFGTRIHPLFGKMKMHNGADLKANYENVHSVMDGIVTEAGWDSGGGGNYIKIKHSNSYVTSYLHLSQIYYKVGEYVKAGFIIAKSGNSGNSTGAHLHFSVTENGNYINPILFLNDLIKANNLIATYYAN